mmetsp:Transcript_39432/g.84025  ORF Transcript_39432/g.84025 Transcript_39432/m.84025 type:complete len:232 (-) Transcript_39432:355-1050(-)
MLDQAQSSSSTSTSSWLCWHGMRTRLPLSCRASICITICSVIDLRRGAASTIEKPSVSGWISSVGGDGDMAERSMSWNIVLTHGTSMRCPSGAASPQPACVGWESVSTCATKSSGSGLFHHDESLTEPPPLGRSYLMPPLATVKLRKWATAPSLASCMRTRISSPSRIEVPEVPSSDCQLKGRAMLSGSLSSNCNAFWTVTLIAPAWIEWATLRPATLCEKASDPSAAHFP